MDPEKGNEIAKALRNRFECDAILDARSQPGRRFETFGFESIGQDEPVEDAGFDCARRIVDCRMNQSSIEMTFRKAGPREFKSKCRESHSDRGLVHSDLEITLRADSLVPGHRDEGTHRDRMASASDHDRLWVIEDRHQERRARFQHRACGNWAFLHRR